MADTGLKIHDRRGPHWFRLYRAPPFYNHLCYSTMILEGNTCRLIDGENDDVECLDTCLASQLANSYLL